MYSFTSYLHPHPHLASCLAAVRRGGKSKKLVTEFALFTGGYNNVYCTRIPWTSFSSCQSTITPVRHPIPSPVNVGINGKDTLFYFALSLCNPIDALLHQIHFCVWLFLCLANPEFVSSSIAMNNLADFADSSFRCTPMPLRVFYPFSSLEPVLITRVYICVRSHEKFALPLSHSA